MKIMNKEKHNNVLSCFHHGLESMHWVQPPYTCTTITSLLLINISIPFSGFKRTTRPIIIIWPMPWHAQERPFIYFDMGTSSWNWYTSIFHHHSHPNNNTISWCCPIAYLVPQDLLAVAFLELSSYTTWGYFQSVYFWWHFQWQTYILAQSAKAKISTTICINTL